MAQLVPLVRGVGGFLEKVTLIENMMETPFLLHLPGRIRTRRQSSGSATSVATTPDNRGRSRAKVVSQSQRKKYILYSLLSLFCSTAHSTVEKLIVFSLLQGKNTFVWL